MGSPAIFRSSADALGTDWKKVQQKFMKLKRHRRHNGQNITHYRVKGGSPIKGVLIEDPAQVLVGELPAPNPLLRPAS